MRTHHGRAVNDNWSWEKDDAATAHFARWARLHLRLFPYLYAMARDAAEKGDPMFRPLAYDHPDFAPGWTSVDEYGLGDRIVVAPVVTEGAVTRPVLLPAGDWFPLLGGARVRSDGVAALDVDVPRAEIPAFVPAGTLLALLPEDVQTLAPATATGVVDLAAARDDRELWLWPGGTSSLEEARGGLSYTWDAAGLTGPVTSATWNGAAVAAESDGSYLLTGSGTLVLDGGEATLVVAGGGKDRTLVGRVRGL
jgi:alpha-glucosidase (family GH31 glycosyl hydrolase)